jgi:negative regulator of genetic competence, sporulation and motility
MSVSCKKVNQWLGADSKEQVYNLQEENRALKEQIRKDSLRYQEELNVIRSSSENQLASEQQDIESGKIPEYKVYYVVVGSFKNMKYAIEYSEKVQAMGYEGKIVDGPNNFNLVTSGTFQTLGSAKEPLKVARGTLASESWIYFLN